MLDIVNWVAVGPALTSFSTVVLKARKTLVPDAGASLKV